MDDTLINHHWRERMRKRRGRALTTFPTQELNLVAMMDMMTIILVFLLKSYSASALSINTSEAIQVPRSTNDASGQEALKLAVTNRSVDGQPGFLLLDDEKIMILDDKNLDIIKKSTAKGDYVIPDLSKVLLDKAAKAKALVQEVNALQTKAPPPTGGKEQGTKPAGAEFEGKILIVADKKVPFWLMASVLVTSAQAGYDRYNFVAVKENQD